MSKLNLGDSLILDSNYSTGAEVKTGATWIDGKPIYRKVFTITTSVDNAWITYDDDETHNIVFTLGKIGGYIVPFYQANNSNYWFAIYNRTYRCGSGILSNSGYIVAFYTKTTD